MSTPNQLTEEQILAEVQRTLETNTQNQGKPRIKVGDQEFDPQNAQAIQDAINNALSANKNDFDALHRQVQQLTNTRVVKPEETAQPPQTQTPPQNIKRPRSVTDEEWSQEFVKAPQRVIDETLARMLGVEGSGSQAILGAFTTLKSELDEAKVQNAALLVKAQELDLKIGANEARTEAQQFIDTYTDYEINPQNQVIMENYLTSYGLAPTARNLGLVFNQAKAEGVIQPKQTQQSQNFNPQQQQTLRSGMPRLNGQSAPSMDGNYLLEQANNLPIDQHAALIERLRNGTFQR